MEQYRYLHILWGGSGRWSAWASPHKVGLRRWTKASEICLGHGHVPRRCPASEFPKVVVRQLRRRLAEHGRTRLGGYALGGGYIHTVPLPDDLRRAVAVEAKQAG